MVWPCVSDDSIRHVWLMCVCVCLYDCNSTGVHVASLQPLADGREDQQRAEPVPRPGDSERRPVHHTEHDRV